MTGILDSVMTKGRFGLERLLVGIVVLAQERTNYGPTRVLAYTRRVNSQHFSLSALVISF